MGKLSSGHTSKPWVRIYPLDRERVLPESQQDGHDYNHLVQVHRSDSVRDLRSSLLDSVYGLKHSADLSKRAVCVITDSKLTEQRIWEELRQFKSVIDPELVARIQIAFFSNDQRSPTPIQRDGFTEWLMQVVQEQPLKESPKGIAPRTVFAHLVRSWFAGQEAIPVKSIQQATMLSYPTVAKVLEDLAAKGVLLRTSDRRVGLIDFPWDEWRRWSTVGSSKREALYYVDPTGLPAASERMASRLSRTAYPQFAVSGVIGAKHYFPELDIRGHTRLDLVATGNEDALYTDVIRELDPALELGDAKSLDAAVVVHFPEQRSGDLFQMDGDKQWADPLDCLADLYEMRLDAQADEMVHFLIYKRSSELKTMVEATGSPWRSGRE